MTNTIPPARLAEIGEAIFGRGWQRPMAVAVGVNERTVRRWAKRGAPIHVKPALRSTALVAAGRLREAIDLLAD